MSKNYVKIQQALELETLESNRDNSLWLHEEFADKLNEALENKEKTEMTLQAKVDEIKNLNEIVKQKEKDCQEKAAALQSQQSDNAQKEATISELNQKVSELQSSLDAVTAERDDLKAKLETKESELNELADKPASLSQPEVPEQHRQSESTRLPSSYSTLEEQRRAKQEFMKTIAALR